MKNQEEITPASVVTKSLNGFKEYQAELEEDLRCQEQRVQATKNIIAGNEAKIRVFGEWLESDITKRANTPSRCMLKPEQTLKFDLVALLINAGVTKGEVKDTANLLLEWILDCPHPQPCSTGDKV